MTKDVWVIFPMAGEGARFGYQFKPFLKATEDTFIQLAKSGFDVLKDHGYEVHYMFAYRRCQEEAYHVHETLQAFFPNDSVNVCTIESSEGPLDTLQQTVVAKGLRGPAFVCDCDHMIDISPTIEYLKNNRNMPDILVPTFSIPKEQHPLYGKVRIGADGNPIQFVEKEDLVHHPGESVFGILGCYFLCDVSIVSDFPCLADMSAMLQRMLKEGTRYTLRTVLIQRAYFFGTPKQLEEFRFARAQKYTLFVDVDGVLVHQETKEYIRGGVERLHQWRAQGHRICLTSASDREYVRCMCERYQIPHDDIISNLSPGPRIVINDTKPYLPYYRMADGIMIARNTGIAQLDLEAMYKPPRIVKKLKGASFAQTYLVSYPGTGTSASASAPSCFVRKHIIKTGTNMVHVEVLRRQCDDLKRWNHLSPGIVPKVIDLVETSSDICLDMEYLDGYDTLACHDTRVIQNVLPRLLHTLHKEVYCMRKRIHHPDDWLQTYLHEKIDAKYPLLSRLSPSIWGLIDHHGITINGRSYKSIRDRLSGVSWGPYAPTHECMIHGDLTLENIMYHAETGDVRVIDHAGSRYLDAVEMDIAKLFQSIVCEYNTWDTLLPSIESDPENSTYVLPTRLIKNAGDVVELHREWLTMFDKSAHNAYYKGCFYMSTYFVRMVPFFVEISEEHAILLLLLAHVYLDQAEEGLKDLQPSEEGILAE